jgi:hypothetical protein
MKHTAGSAVPADRCVAHTLQGAVLALCLALVGCDRGATEATTPSVRVETRPPAAAQAEPPPPVAGIAAPSTIEGDRLVGSLLAETAPPVPQEPSPFRFTDIATQAGIDFVHFSGVTKERHFPTENGSGVAIFDYDGDGRLDLYFATLTLLPLGTAKKGPNRLYRNQGDGTFRDVTESSGLGFAGFCHGIIVGDIDNDGDPDVFLCNYGSNVLYLNEGQGRFVDISHAAGIDRPSWSSGGAFLDYDGDGDLDLYVANYGEWKLPEDDVFCGDRAKHVRLFCSPLTIRTTRHFLYRNNGDRTFTEASSEAGITRADGHGFGVVTTDLNGDGKVDIYVANDMNPNFLYLNKGDGTFEDVTEISGAGLDGRGQAQAGMGVDAEDIDGDGLPELFVTNFQNEYNTLYSNLGGGTFLDATAFLGLAADSLPWVGWGCALGDFDNDGWPDCFVANGHVDDNRREIGQPIDQPEPPLLHRNVPLNRPRTDAASGGTGAGPGRFFRLATRDVGAYFASKHVARGAGFGDLDDDGDLDIVVSHLDGRPAVLRNDTPGENRWVRLRLVGTRSNRDAIGAGVVLETAERTIHRQRKGGCSLQSSHDPRLLIGLGPAREVVRLTVRWPSGAVTVREHLATNTTYEIVEGANEP